MRGSGLVIETYDERTVGTTKVFFKIRNGSVSSVLVGNKAISTEQGFQFYVDDYVAEQIEKCELYMDGFTPKLRVIEGEEIEVPQLSEKELAIRQKEYELEQLRNAE